MRYGNILAALAIALLCVSSARAVCGDGILEVGEQCDGAAGTPGNNAACCNSDCTTNPIQCCLIDGFSCLLQPSCDSTPICDPSNPASGADGCYDDGPFECPGCDLCSVDPFLDPEPVCTPRACREFCISTTGQLGYSSAGAPNTGCTPGSPCNVTWHWKIEFPSANVLDVDFIVGPSGASLSQSPQYAQYVANSQIDCIDFAFGGIMTISSNVSPNQRYSYEFVLNRSCTNYFAEFPTGTGSRFSAVLLDDPILGFYRDSVASSIVCYTDNPATSGCSLEAGELPCFPSESPTPTPSTTRSATPTPSAVPTSSRTQTPTPTRQPVCGDGIVEGDEECDIFAPNHPGVAGCCTDQCTFASLCCRFTGAGGCSSSFGTCENVNVCEPTNPLADGSGCYDSGPLQCEGCSVCEKIFFDEIICKNVADRERCEGNSSCPDWGYCDVDSCECGDREICLAGTFFSRNGSSAGNLAACPSTQDCYSTVLIKYDRGTNTVIEYANQVGPTNPPTTHLTLGSPGLNCNSAVRTLTFQTSTSTLPFSTLPFTVGQPITSPCTDLLLADPLSPFAFRGHGVNEGSGNSRSFNPLVNLDLSMLRVPCETLTCFGPDDCNDMEECTVDTCQAGTCVNTPVADNTPCTPVQVGATGLCNSGQCAPVPSPSASQTPLPTTSSTSSPSGTSSPSSTPSASISAAASQSRTPSSSSSPSGTPSASVEPDCEPQCTNDEDFWEDACLCPSSSGGGRGSSGKRCGCCNKCDNPKKRCGCCDKCEPSSSPTSSPPPCEPTEAACTDPIIQTTLLSGKTCLEIYAMSEDEQDDFGQDLWRLSKSWCTVTLNLVRDDCDQVKPTFVAFKYNYVTGIVVDGNLVGSSDTNWFYRVLALSLDKWSSGGYARFGGPGECCVDDDDDDDDDNHHEDRTWNWWSPPPRKCVIRGDRRRSLSQGDDGNIGYTGRVDCCLISGDELAAYAENFTDLVMCDNTLSLGAGLFSDNAPLVAYAASQLHASYCVVSPQEIVDQVARLGDYIERMCRREAVDQAAIDWTTDMVNGYINGTLGDFGGPCSCSNTTCLEMKKELQPRHLFSGDQPLDTLARKSRKADNTARNAGISVGVVLVALGVACTFFILFAVAVVVLIRHKPNNPSGSEAVMGEVETALVSGMKTLISDESTGDDDANF